MDRVIMTSLDSFRCCKALKGGSKTYAYFSLPAAEKNGLKGISRLPFSLKVLLENMLRHEDGRTVTKDDILGFAQWLKTKTSDREIPFRPARVLMQDFTGVPAVVDLAAMRDAMDHLGGAAGEIGQLEGALGSQIDLLSRIQVAEGGHPSCADTLGFLDDGRVDRASIAIAGIAGVRGRSRC